MDLITPDLGLMFWTGLVFLLLMFVLTKFVWKPILAAVNSSEQSITASLELAEKTMNEMKALQAQNEDLLKEAGKQMRTVWDIPNNKKREELACGKHPTQKPVRLLRRMLEISARPGDLLLVPFAGSGSDCVAAKGAGVNFVGFETDPEFVRMSNERVSTLKPDTQLELGR